MFVEGLRTPFYTAGMDPSRPQEPSAGRPRNRQAAPPSEPGKRALAGTHGPDGEPGKHALAGTHDPGGGPGRVGVPPLPAPPPRVARRRSAVGRKPTLSVPVIVAAAIEVLDEAG